MSDDNIKKVNIVINDYKKFLNLFILYHLETLDCYNIEKQSVLQSILRDKNTAYIQKICNIYHILRYRKVSYNMYYEISNVKKSFFLDNIILYINNLLFDRSDDGRFKDIINIKALQRIYPSKFGSIEFCDKEIREIFKQIRNKKISHHIATNDYHIQNKSLHIHYEHILKTAIQISNYLTKLCKKEQIDHILDNNELNFSSYAVIKKSYCFGNKCIKDLKNIIDDKIKSIQYIDSTIVKIHKDLDYCTHHTKYLIRDNDKLFEILNCWFELQKPKYIQPLN
jgi:hypothetical protein